MTIVYTKTDNLTSCRKETLTKAYCYTVALEQLQRAERAEAEADTLRSENGDLIREVERLNGVIDHHLDDKDALREQLAHARATIEAMRDTSKVTWTFRRTA